jgi:hypothetical protein
MNGEDVTREETMRTAITTCSLLLSAITLTAYSATPSKLDPSVVDFRRTLDAASSAFTSQAYFTSMEQLQQALQMANEAQQSAVLELLPAAPIGYRDVPIPAPIERKGLDPLSKAVMLAGVRPAERRYESMESGAVITMAVAPNAPLAASLKQQIANAEGKEQVSVVTLNDRAGLATEWGGVTSLRFALLDRHLLEIRGQGATKEELLGFLKREMLDKLETTLSR